MYVSLFPSPFHCSNPILMKSILTYNSLSRVFKAHLALLYYAFILGVPWHFAACQRLHRLALLLRYSLGNGTPNFWVCSQIPKPFSYPDILVSILHTLIHLHSCIMSHWKTLCAFFYPKALYRVAQKHAHSYKKSKNIPSLMWKI